VGTRQHVIGLLMILSVALAPAACEKAPPPGPPPALGKLEPLEPTPAGAARSEQLKQQQPPPVDTRDLVDGGVRLRWKVPEGERAQAFSVTVRPNRPGGCTALKINTRKLPRLKPKQLLALERLMSMRLPRSYDLTGLVRIKSQEYHTVAVDYVMGRLKPALLPRDRAVQKALKALQGKTVVSVELGDNGAVLGVNSPTMSDYNLQLILLELPEQRVKPGDTWPLQLRPFTHELFQQKKLSKKAQVSLIDVKQAKDGVLAILKYDLHMKQTGAFLRIAPRPVGQSIDLRFKGQGVFDVSGGCWKSLVVRYQMTASGLIQYRDDQRIKITPLPRPPKKLQEASR